MPLLRKRKTTTEDDTIEVSRSSKQVKTIHVINSKAKSTRAKPVSVLQPSSHDADKENIIHNQKRKREDEDGVISQQNGKRVRDNVVKRRDIVPQSPKRVRAMPPSPMETPGRRTARLFDRLDLKNRTPSSRISQDGYDTPPTSPDTLFDLADTLPSALTDLIGTHAAFLSALNEQMALNSSEFRIQLRDLLLSMTSVWKRRSLTLEDLRRVLAIQESGWRLEDFGRAGLGLVRLGSVGARLSILDTNEQKRSFETQLRRKWNAWRKNEQNNSAKFVEQLPLAIVTVSGTVEGSTAFHVKGQDRLVSLKASQAAAQESSAKQDAVITSQAATSTRGTDLLERVLAKQSMISNLPAGPTKAQLERKASLQRVEEIVRILDVLSGGRARASFSMQSVAQQIQQSLRSPMSRVEIDKCLTTIATEVMPEFVSIVSSGSVIGVVITRAGKLGLADLKKVIADIDV